MQTLIQQLLKEIKHRDYWVQGAVLERMVFVNPKTKTTYKPATISRKLRLLQETMPDRIEKQEQGRAGSVAYRYIKNNYEKLHSDVKHGKAGVKEINGQRIISLGF